MTAVAAVLTPSRASPADRLGVTLALALLLHAILIFGVSFRAEDREPPELDTMEVILVQRASPEPVEQAEALANLAQAGGGEETEGKRPAVPLPAPRVAPTPEVVAAAPQPPAPVVPPAPEPAIRPERVTEPAPEAATPKPVLTVEAPEPERPRAERREAKKETEKRAERSAPAKPEPAPPKPEDSPAVAERPAEPRPSAAALVANSFQTASLDAELANRVDTASQRPRRKFISANTREYKFAAYMEAWRAKVERIGNLNYPDEARRKKLSGSLILDVALNADGSIADITIRRPSGHAVLDDAAVRIVRLAAPYAPFPKEFRDEVDVLHITRTWQFLNTNRFAGQ